MFSEAIYGEGLRESGERGGRAGRERRGSRRVWDCFPVNSICWGFSRILRMFTDSSKDSYGFSRILLRILRDFHGFF